MKHLLRVAPIAVPVAFMVALVVPAMTPQIASASPVDQKRAEVEDIVDQLEQLEEKALEIGEDYVEAVQEKEQLDQEIVDLEARIAVKETELGELRADLGDMAVRSFVGSGTTPLGPLFEDAADVNDVLQRDELARVALSAGDVTTDELDAFVDDLEEDRTTLDEKVEEAEALAASLVDAQAETEKLTGEYQQARIDAEAELGDLIAEEEARRAAESAARLQAEVEAAQNAANAANDNNANNGSGNDDSGGTNSGGTTGDDSGGTTGNGGGDTTGGNGGNAGGGGGGGNTPAAEAPAPQAPSAPSAPPPSSRAGVAVNAALSQQGVPYKYATSNPGVSFDCSGLTAYAWAAAGVYLPHQSAQQYASIPHVDKGSAQPGDLLFYYSPISHVGVYLGGGQLVHAPNTGSVVNIASVNWGKVSGVGRPG
ncbi:MAG: NlpC/P60 family protein [Ilumatobacter sp.]|uniref:C40 family peptidase n=1 Tax=Ilumatobacter sp. TaxID=1967498 RepID=UPI0032992369